MRPISRLDDMVLQHPALRIQCRRALRIHGKDFAIGTFITLADLGEGGLPLLSKLLHIGTLSLVGQEEVFVTKKKNRKDK